MIHRKILIALKSLRTFFQYIHKPSTYLRSTFEIYEAYSSFPFRRCIPFKTEKRIYYYVPSIDPTIGKLMCRNMNLFNFALSSSSSAPSGPRVEILINEDLRSSILISCLRLTRILKCLENTRNKFHENFNSFSFPLGHNSLMLNKCYPN